MFDLFLLTLDDDDRKKIERIYISYKDYMKKIALKQLWNLTSELREFEAEEAVVRSYIKLCKYIDKVDTEYNNSDLKSYLYVVVTNEVMNVMNEHRDTVDIDQVDYDSSVMKDLMSEIEQQIEYEDLKEAVKKLKETSKMTLYYIYNQGLSVKETAKIMKVPTKTVYTRLKRAYVMLKKVLSRGDAS